MKYWLVIIALYLVAFGTIWTAYESHIANIGVWAWQHQFDEIRHGDMRPSSPPPPLSRNHTYSE